MRHKYKRFLKAAYIDYSEDYCSSGPSTFTKPTVTTPIIVITGTTAIIACAVSGATIYYTLDGSTPTSSSTEYTGAITLTLSCTIKAIAVKPDMTDSAVAEESYVKPITYLTQWKIVGNSEVHGQEIWSCGEYNPIDGKYHILVQPLGGSIVDIALDKPLRKVNDVADTIEFPIVLEAFTDADGNQIATTLPDDTILHIQNLYDYTQTNRINVGFNDVSQRSAEIIIISIIGANYCGINMPLQSGNYYTSCLFKNEDAKPNVIYSNSGNSSTVSSSDYQKISLLESDVTTFRFSALNNPTGVWELNDVFFVNDINIFDIDAMFADCTDLKPASNTAFETLFPNLGCIDKTDTAIDVIVKDGKLYKYVETEGKALVTRNLKAISLEGKSWNTNDAPRYVLYIVGREYDFPESTRVQGCIMCSTYTETTFLNTYNTDKSIGMAWNGSYNLISVKDTDVVTPKTDITGEAIFKLTTPTTELVDAPQIAEAESYTCVISQGAKAVSWSSFETE